MEENILKGQSYSGRIMCMALIWGYEHVIPELITKIINLKTSQGKNITLPIQADGNQSRAFIYIDHFVDGVLILLEKGENRNIYNIGTTDEITIKKLISFT